MIGYRLHNQQGNPRNKVTGQVWLRILICRYVGYHAQTALVMSLMIG